MKRCNAHFAQKRLFRKLALWLVWLGAAIGLMSGLSTHPFIARGVWADGETSGMVMLASAGACLIGVGWLALVSHAGRRTLSQPVVLLSLLTGFWALLSIPGAQMPGLALFGTPQTSQGPLWYFSFSAFLAAGLLFPPRRSAGKLLWGLLLVTALLTAYLNIPLDEWLTQVLPHSVIPSQAISGFSKYEVYYAVALLPFLLLNWRKERAGAAGLVAFVLLVVAVLAHNRTAQIALGLGALSAMAVTSDRARGLIPLGLRTPRAGITAAALAVLLMALLPYLLLRVAPQVHSVNSLESRTVLGKVIEPTAQTSVKDWVLGHGWGHYQEALVANVPRTGIRLYNTEWSDLSRDEFHSHNALLEALYANGLPGAILSLAIPLAILVLAAPPLRGAALALVIAWVSTDALWFMMPCTLPALALSVASVSGGRRRPWHRLCERSLDRFFLQPLLCVALIGVGGLAIGFAWLSRDYALQTDLVAACLGKGGCQPISVPEDPRGSDLALSYVLVNALPDGRAAEQNHRMDEARRQAFRTVIAALSKRARDGHHALALSLAVINAYASGGFDPAGAVLLPGGGVDADDWSAQIEAVLQRAPERSDVASTYLNWLLVQGDMARYDRLLDIMSHAATDNPVLDWFRGVRLISANDPQSVAAGLQLMRKSVDGGVERFFPIEDDVKAMLKGGGR